MKSINRKRILNEGLVDKTKKIKLRFSTHATERMKEYGIHTIPNHITIREDNVYCGKMKNEKLDTVVVRLKHDENTYLFLCILLRNSLVKTIWFRNKKREK